MHFQNIIMAASRFFVMLTSIRSKCFKSGSLTIKGYLTKLNLPSLCLQCRHCGKAFASHAAHDSHVRRTHTKDKPCVCSICGKNFSQQYELKLHMNVHSMEWPATSVARTSLSSTNSNYTWMSTPWSDLQHLWQELLSAVRTQITHECPLHGVTCNICGKNFSQQYELKLHMNVHSMEWPATSVARTSLSSTNSNYTWMSTPWSDHCDILQTL